MWFIMLLQGIGLFLLAILLLFLLIVALILFVPIRYSVWFDKQTDMLLDVKVSWLLRILSFAYSMKNKEGTPKAKLFGWDLMTSKPKKKPQKKPKEKPKEKPRKQEPKKQEKVQQKKEPEQTKKEASPKAKTEDKKESFQDKMESIKNRFDSAYHYPDRNILIKLTVNYLKKMAWAAKPKVFSVKAEVGTNDPAQVGYILGIAQTIIPFTPFDVHIKGVFDQEVFNGSVRVKGNLYLYRFVFPTARFLIAKPVRKMIKNIFF